MADKKKSEKDANKLRSLRVFDFDGTIADSPHPDTPIEGVPALQYYDEWLASNGMPKRKFLGWWGRTETLLPPIFGKWDSEGNLVPPPEWLHEDIAALARDYKADESCLSILMTGRHVGMRHEYKGERQHAVKTITDAYGLSFDRYYYGSTGQPTLTFKLNTIQAILREIPTIRMVEIWEDRHQHTSEFWNFVKYYKRIGKLENGLVHQVEPKETYDDMPTDS